MRKVCLGPTLCEVYGGDRGHVVHVNALAASIKVRHLWTRSKVMENNNWPK